MNVVFVEGLFVSIYCCFGFSCVVGYCVGLYVVCFQLQFEFVYYVDYWLQLVVVCGEIVFDVYWYFWIDGLLYEFCVFQCMQVEC